MRAGQGVVGATHNAFGKAAGATDFPPGEGGKVKIHSLPLKASVFGQGYALRLNGADFGAHSLPTGFLTSAARRGASDGEFHCTDPLFFPNTPVSQSVSPEGSHHSETVLGTLPSHLLAAVRVASAVASACIVPACGAICAAISASLDAT